MTESEWLACTDPTILLNFLRDQASDRKLRLFACACCRRIWNWVTDKQCRRVVELTEQAVDGFLDVEAVNAIDWGYVTDDCGGPGEPYRTAFMVAGHVGYGIFAPMRPWFNKGLTWTIDDETRLTADAAEGSAWVAAEATTAFPNRPFTTDDLKIWESLVQAEKERQTPLLRDIVGNPFQPVGIDLAWLRWRDGTIAHIAHAIYNHRSFQDLPVLADALEEAGCTTPEILDHCRGPGEHVRGCWMVDSVLGRK